MGGGNSVSALQLLILVFLAACLGLILVLLAHYSRRERESVRRTEEAARATKEWLEHVLREELSVSRAEAARSSSDLRGEVSASVERMGVSLREEVAGRLREIREDNDRRLEEMRRTVDDKLHDTLERRLGESFRQVSERLEQVHQGLGEMHALAAGVGDLKRVLTNVKTRGTWGEVQLGCLLEQVMAPDQYQANVATKDGNERVEFALRLPGRDGEGGCVWLPIDAKFPLEDYQRLLDALERGDPAAAETCARALEQRVKLSARDIRDKYISPPATTDFGIMFLPTEGLYAEVLRRPGLVEILQQEYRVVVAGPTTLTALLNSLQVGFRTLAIEKRSSEVWQLLGAVRSEFGEFGEVLARAQKKLHQASESIDDAARKSRRIERSLRTVEEAPPDKTVRSPAEDLRSPADDSSPT